MQSIMTLNGVTFVAWVITLGYEGDNQGATRAASGWINDRQRNYGTANMRTKIADETRELFRQLNGGAVLHPVAGAQGPNDPVVRNFGVQMDEFVDAMAGLRVDEDAGDPRVRQPQQGHRAPPPEAVAPPTCMQRLMRAMCFLRAGSSASRVDAPEWHYCADGSRFRHIRGSSALLVEKPPVHDSMAFPTFAEWAGDDEAECALLQREACHAMPPPEQTKERRRPP